MATNNGLVKSCQSLIISKGTVDFQAHTSHSGNGDPWSGDWKTRVKRRVVERGYKSVIEMCRANEALPYTKLAQLVGSDVAPVQVVILFREESLLMGEYDLFVKSSLVRSLHEKLLDGWSDKKEVDFQEAWALASWETMIGEQNQDEANRVKKALLEMQIPKGWLPKNISDPILVQAFQGRSFCGHLE